MTTEFCCTCHFPSNFLLATYVMQNILIIFYLFFRFADSQLNMFRFTFTTLSMGTYFLLKRKLPSIQRQKIVAVLGYGFLTSLTQVSFRWLLKDVGLSSDSPYHSLVKVQIHITYLDIWTVFQVQNLHRIKSLWSDFRFIFGDPTWLVRDDIYAESGTWTFKNWHNIVSCIFACKLVYKFRFI